MGKEEFSSATPLKKRRVTPTIRKKKETDLDGQQLFDGGYKRALDWMNTAIIAWWSLLSTY
jgi:hypothetical protein